MLPASVAAVPALLAAVAALLATVAALLPAVAALLLAVAALLAIQLAREDGALRVLLVQADLLAIVQDVALVLLKPLPKSAEARAHARRTVAERYERGGAIGGD